jgi:hypothetical protein
MTKTGTFLKTPGAPEAPLIRILPVVLFLVCCPAVLAAPEKTESNPGSPLSQEKSVGGKISGDVSLSGRVRVTEDLLVLPGATLEITPGAVVVFSKSESSKVEPEYFFGGTELVVRGTLRAAGAKFLFQERSGGIVVDGGSAHIADTVVAGAETGITLLRGGAVAAEGTLTVTDSRVGVSLFPGSGGWTGAGEVRLRKNGIGAVRFPGADLLPGTFRPGDSEEADKLEWDAGPVPREEKPFSHPAPRAGALHLGDTFLDRNRTLSGDVVVDGVIRVAPGAILTITPGSRLFFTFRDTDGDGIGENGIFLQGNLDARGSKERPIGFYPLGGKGPGRWDSINFMASDRGKNVIENAEIAGAYRGIHAHFSRLRGSGIRISGCFRGIQFQESEVELSGVEVASSRSAIRCRDSDVRIDGIRIRDTVSGGNFFRSRVAISSPDVSRSGWYGFRFRESRVELASGEVREAMVGVSVQEGSVRLDRTSIAFCGLSGFALLEGDAKIDNCAVSGSRLDAVSATRGKISVSGGELSGYGRYAVKLGGPAEVTLAGVEYAGGGGALSGKPIYDGKVAPGLGVVRIE